MDLGEQGPTPRGRGAHGRSPSAGAGTAPARRRRGAELEDAILAAAWDVLTESGYEGFTFEAIATRAATSRPVLYRRWPQRTDLLRATLQRYWGRNALSIPDTGSLRQDGIVFLRSNNRTRSGMITVLNVQLAGYFRETGSTINDLRAALRGAHTTTACETMVARAVERGEIPDVPRPTRMVNLPMDLFRHELLLTMRAIPEEGIVEIIDELWLPLLRG